MMFEEALFILSHLPPIGSATSVNLHTSRSFEVVESRISPIGSEIMSVKRVLVIAGSDSSGGA